MKIRIIAVGKVKEKFMRQGIEEYQKRMGTYLPLEIIEVRDEAAAESLSDLEEKKVKDKEGARILEKIGPRDRVVVLAIGGKSLDSVQFSKFIFDQALEGVSNLVFVIGGSLGLSEEVMKRGDFSLSFSSMTFPHQLMRLILMEQVYRACRIEAGHAYHK